MRIIHGPDWSRPLAARRERGPRPRGGRPGSRRSPRSGRRAGTARTTGRARAAGAARRAGGRAGPGTPGTASTTRGPNACAGRSRPASGTEPAYASPYASPVPLPENAAGVPGLRRHDQPCRRRACTCSSGSRRGGAAVDAEYDARRDRQPGLPARRVGPAPAGRGAAAVGRGGGAARPRPRGARRGRSGRGRGGEHRLGRLRLLRRGGLRPPRHPGADQRGRLGAGRLEFPNEDRCCACSSCGTCKQAPIKDARHRGRATVLVGDGTSDRKAALLADVVFAKGALASWCAANGVALTSVRRPSADVHAALRDLEFAAMKVVARIRRAHAADRCRCRGSGVRGHDVEVVGPPGGRGSSVGRRSVATVGELVAKGDGRYRRPVLLHGDRGVDRGQQGARRAAPRSARTRRRPRARGSGTTRTCW